MDIKNFKDFEKLVKSGGLKGVFIIYGDEKQLIKESIRLVYNEIKSFTELNITCLYDEGITIDNIINACETLPFMSDKKVVHIKNPGFIKKNKADGGDNTKANAPNNEIVDNLSNYIKGISQDTVFLITCEGEIDTRNKLAVTAKTFGNLVEYSLLKGIELQKWVGDMFSSRGKEISKSELVYFLSEVGSSIELIETEIEKLCMYDAEGSVIGRKQIDEIVSKSTESNIFKMVDNISRKDADGSISILTNLLFQKEDHLRILGMIIRQYRLLLMITLQAKNNIPGDSIRSNLKLQDFVFQNLLKQSRAYDDASLKKALERCLDTDFMIKSGKLAPDLALEMLIIELCK